MTVKEANAIVKQNKECCEKLFKGECDRIRCMVGCEKYDFQKSQEVRQMAFRSLEAWEKVIEEIEQLRARFKEIGGVYEYSVYGLDYATEIIKKHLSEVEDEQTER